MEYFKELGCFNFTSPPQSICTFRIPRKEVCQKVYAISRISPYINKNKILLQCLIIKSHFNNCLLAWLICSRQLNNEINKVQESALRLTVLTRKVVR